MRNLFRYVALAGLFAAMAMAAAGQSNTDNKDLLLKATQILEVQPFHEKAKDFRGWAMRYIIETDDVSILVCAGPLLEPIMDKKNKYANELLAQYSMGMAAFKLANPDKAKDENAAQIAGIESALRSYESMVKEKPKAKFQGMDDLAAKAKNGELKKMVEDAKCGSGKTEPIKSN